MKEISFTDLLTKYKATTTAAPIELSDEENLANTLKEQLLAIGASILWSGELENIWFFIIIKTRNFTALKHFDENIFQPVRLTEKLSLPVLHIIQIGGQDYDISWEQLQHQTPALAPFANLMHILQLHKVDIVNINNQYNLKCFIDSIR